MKNKNNIFGYTIMLLLISLGVVYGIYTTRLQGVLSQEATSALSQEVTNQNELYNQTAMPTIFAPTQHPPTVTLNWAYADSSLLSLNLTISGLELVANMDDLENVVCDPYINPDEPVSLAIKYREAEIPSQPGEPIELTYEYEMDASEYKSITFNLDLTLGPCADYLNFSETNVTPSLPLPELIANYHLSFQVPVR